MKKQTAFLISILMLFTSFHSVGVLASESEWNRCSYEVYTLNGLELTNEEEYSSKTCGDLITRAEFAQILANITGFISADNKTGYWDVPADSEYADAIYSLRNCLIMVGYSDKEFRPYEEMTLHQAATVLLRMLGYGQIIKSDDDIMKFAGDLKLYKNVVCAPQDKMTKGNAAVLIYNALFADMLVVDFGRNEYRVSKDENILSKYMRIYKDRGIITQSYYSALTEDSGLKPNEDEIVINNSIYCVSEYPEAKKYFGYNVDYYYKEDDEGDSIVYVYPQKNTVYTVNSEDFDGIYNNTFKFVTSTTNYYTTEKTKSVRLSDTLDVVYNGVVCPDYTADDLLLKDTSGYSVFIDNNSDGAIDVILVTECRNYMVDYANEELMQIFTKWQGVVDLKNTENLFVYDSNGTKIEFSTIMSTDIVTVQMSKDGKNAVLIKSNNSEDSAVKKIDYGKHTIVLDDGREYYADNSLWLRIDEIRIGAYGTFFFDYRNRVAGVMFENYGFNENYGFLSRIFFDEEDETVTVKLFRLSGKMESYILKEKLTVDGVKIKDKDFYNMMRIQDNDGTFYTNRQMIKFMLNDEGQIRYIDTPNKGDKETEDNLTVLGYRNATQWEGGGGYLEQYVALTMDPVAMVVPMPAEGEAKSLSNSFADSDYFVIKNVSNLDITDFDAIDPNSGGVCTIIVNYYKKGIGVKNYGGDVDFKDYKSSPSVMVDSIRTELRDDEVVYSLKYFENNAEKTAYAEYDKIFAKEIYTADGMPTGKYKGLVKGDIIRMHMKPNGVIDAVHVDFDVERTDNKIFRCADLNELNESECGVVYAGTERGIKLFTNVVTFGEYSPESIDRNKWVSRLYNSEIAFTMYDRNDKIIKDASADDVIGFMQDSVNPSVVFARLISGGYNQMFIIR